MTTQDFSHQFFTCGLVYSTFFSIILTIRGLLRSMGWGNGQPVEAFTLDPAAFHGDQGERAVDRALREEGIPTLRNVFIYRPGGHLTEVDLLALVGTEILVIEVKAWVGQVLGEVDDDEWIQSKRRGTNKMLKNPLHQNRHHLRAVQTALPKARSVGVVVFTEAAFPNGQPNGAVDIPGLLQLVADGRNAEPDMATMLAWGRLSTWSMRQDKKELHDVLVGQIRDRIALTRNVELPRCEERKLRPIGFADV